MKYHDVSTSSYPVVLRLNRWHCGILFWEDILLTYFNGVEAVEFLWLSTFVPRLVFIGVFLAQTFCELLSEKQVQWLGERTCLSSWFLRCNDLKHLLTCYWNVGMLEISAMLVARGHLLLIIFICTYFPSSIFQSQEVSCAGQRPKPARESAGCQSHRPIG